MSKKKVSKHKTLTTPKRKPTKRRSFKVDLREPDQKIVIGGVIYHCFRAPDDETLRKGLDY